MKASIIASIFAFCAFSSAAPTSRISRRQSVLQGTAILQFEIVPDTFTSDTEITIGTVIDFDATPLEVLSIAIATTTDVANPAAIVCEALDQSTVVGKFTVNQDAVFSSLQTVTSISCEDTSTATKPRTMTRKTSSNVISRASQPEAILQFEIAPDAFTSDFEIVLGTVADTDLELISATIASVSGAENQNNVVCTATANFSSNVVGVFTLATTAVFNNGALEEITSITCVENS
ncbi:hypothetical protein AOQ84DRAFT_356192 [Glonium stellatum]|uniref:Uncharacterized protein n=1 Tax=Glonium stellatum TaxID=574774 RepID=A0A8E2JPP8_9PEZI|nr:hypothetical protein AOQ84DRAFT_356192 [Glonium stellatum]